MGGRFEWRRGGGVYRATARFRERTSRGSVLGRDRAISIGLQGGDPAAARAAVEAHLSVVETALNADQKAAQHETIARQRLDRDAKT